MKRKIPKEKRPFFTKQKIFTILIGLFLAGIMITSVLNMGRSAEEEEKYKYKEKTFIKTERGWVTYMDDTPIMLPYGPKELKNITLPLMDISSLNKAHKIYLSIDPSKDHRTAISNLKYYVPFKPVMITACHVDIPECVNVPLKSCEDASNEIGVIIFRDAEKAAVSFEGNCLTFEGSGNDLIKIVSKFIWEIYGLG